MSLFRNRTVLGILCIAVALIICFVITPLVNRGLSSKTDIVRMKRNVSAGEQITKDMVEVVSVGKYNLPTGVCKDINEVVGKYLAADLYDGDYILSSKLTTEPAVEDAYLYSLDGKKQAISVTISKFAKGLSGKLKSGDIVSVIVPDYKNSGTTVTPMELTYVEVIAVTAKSGYDANTSDISERDDEEDNKELPTTVTLLVTPEQSMLLAEIEADYDMHLSLVYRGTRENADKYIAIQQDVLDKKQIAKESVDKWEAAVKYSFTYDADGDGIPDSFEKDEDGNFIEKDASWYKVEAYYFFLERELLDYVPEKWSKNEYF